MVVISDGVRQGVAVSFSASDPDFASAVRGVGDDPERRQVLSRTINGSGTWQTVTYPTAFPEGSKITIIGTAQDDNGSHFFLRTRSITLTNFQFIAVNFNGGHHTGAGVVGFIVERRN